MGQTAKLRVASLAIVGLALLAGCVDEKIVYQDRELFEEPLAAAQNFLGYTDQESKLTVCGNCHIEKQTDWAETGHASAWVDLQDSGHAQDFCEGCHTVSEMGNFVDDPAGYNATQEVRYEDVQCEACHGPGLEHVTNPTDATIPLAALNVGADLGTGCGECHTGTHHGFADEWAQSGHGDPNPYPAGRAECESCHTGEGALRMFGVNTTYLEQADVVDNTDENLPITCAICHDPHGASGNTHQLRWPIDSRDAEVNLCMQCHHKRSIPDETSSRGPHSPQGPLLLGEDVGWIPPNFAYNDQLIRGTHGSEANEELCATCHVNSYTVSDAETGDFVFNVTGHLFKAVPCLDSLGVPTADDSCGLNTTERTFASCTASGCHGSEDAALTAMLIAQDRIAGLVEELDSLVALVPLTEFVTNDGFISVGEGAKFNAGLGAIESSAIHNPFLTEALLTASIEAVQDEYGPFPLLNPERPLRNLMWELSRGGN